ncbi:MAG: hypothetical protein M3463_13445 [Verrucomicrobiota bacterium]|nr:hypothetical protein [Verrucomicrobiota bacterium]
MKTRPPVDLSRLEVRPLAERESLSGLEEILIPPDAPPPACSGPLRDTIAGCAANIRAARASGASVLLIFGAHLIRNGAALLMARLMEGGWVTHLATNGAGTIHDWEYAWLGRSTESVERNVASGTFGIWEETGRNIHLALLAGGLRGDGYGAALGRFISEDGALLPDPEELTAALRAEPAHPLAPARADLLGAMMRHGLKAGWQEVVHRWKHGSVAARAWRAGVPLTVHPGIGYDIIANHPMFNGAVIGRAAGIDFCRFAGAVDGLDGGVVLSIGSAIMGPQVFEKALSCAHNLRFQAGRPRVSGYHIYVVDLQEGGGWDWSRGEPPKDHPAYYLRFCKSYSRMGAAMHYVQEDNARFVHWLYDELRRP